MKQILEFLKTTASGGLFVVLPVLLLFLILGQIFELILALAKPIVSLFPQGTFNDIIFPVLVAVFLILIVSFLIGLVMRSSVGRHMGNWIGQKILGRLPAYNALNRLVKGFAGAEDTIGFRPALMISSDKESEIVYVVEDHGDGRMTVLVPWSPTAFAGTVKIVRRERIQLLDASLDEVSVALSYWGVGVKKLLEKSSRVIDQ